MDAVVGDVTGYHQVDGWDVQARGQSRVRITRVDQDQLVPFQLDGVSLKRVGHRELFRELAGKARIPEAVEVGRIKLTSHGLNDVRPCHRPGMGEALLKQAYAKKMIAMAMGQVNRGQILSARHNP